MVDVFKPDGSRPTLYGVDRDGTIMLGSLMFAWGLIFFLWVFYVYPTIGSPIVMGLSGVVIFATMACFFFLGQAFVLMRFLNRVEPSKDSIRFSEGDIRF